MWSQLHCTDVCLRCLVRLDNVFKFNVLLRQANPPTGVDLYTWADSLLCSQLQGTTPGCLHRHSACHFSCSLNVFLWVLSSALKHHIWVYTFAEKGSVLIMSAHWRLTNESFFLACYLQQAHFQWFPWAVLFLWKNNCTAYIFKWKRKKKNPQEHGAQFLIIFWNHTYMV